MEYTFYRFSGIGNKSLRNGFIIKIHKDKESDIDIFVSAFVNIVDDDKNIYTVRQISEDAALNSDKVIFDYDYVSNTNFFVNLCNAYLTKGKPFVNTKTNTLR